MGAQKASCGLWDPVKIGISAIWSRLLRPGPQGSAVLAACKPAVYGVSEQAQNPSIAVFLYPLMFALISVKFVNGKST